MTSWKSHKDKYNNYFIKSRRLLIVDDELDSGFVLLFILLPTNYFRFGVKIVTISDKFPHRNTFPVLLRMDGDSSHPGLVLSGTLLVSHHTETSVGEGSFSSRILGTGKSQLKIQMVDVSSKKEVFLLYSFSHLSSVPSLRKSRTKRNLFLTQYPFAMKRDFISRYLGIRKDARVENVL